MLVCAYIHACVSMFLGGESSNEWFCVISLYTVTNFLIMKSVSVLN